MCNVTVYRRYEKPQQGFKVLLSARKTTVFTKTCNAPFLTVGLFLFLPPQFLFPFLLYFFHFYFISLFVDPLAIERWAGPVHSTSIQTLLSKANIFIVYFSRVLFIGDTYLKFCSSSEQFYLFQNSS